jgi:hypothetical protein
VQKIAQVGPGKKTRDAAAERAGFGNRETYRQAAKVVESGSARLVQAMDGGRVSISAAALLADGDPDEQDRILDLARRCGCHADGAAGREIPAGHAKSRRRLFFQYAFRERFSLDPEAAGPRVNDFPTVLSGGFSPARFSDFKESQGEFSATTRGNRVGEFLKKRQGRLGMGRRFHRDVTIGDRILNSRPLIP